MASDEPAPKTPPSGDPPPPLAVALTASAATLGVYAVYYLRFTDVVEGFWDRYDARSIWLGVASLLVLMALAGIWAVVCNAPNLRTAFTTGLGFPGLIFGAGLVAGPSSEAGPNERPPAVGDGRERESRPTRVSPGAGIALVFAPVRAVVDVVEERESAKRVELEESVGNMLRELKLTDDQRRVLERRAPPHMRWREDRAPPDGARDAAADPGVDRMRRELTPTHGDG